VVIKREVAGEHTSVLAFPGQSALVAHHKPLSAHIFAGRPSVQ
jgi:hypothetical protein